MTSSIPSIGPDEGMREFNARRSHAHTSERTGDGYAPVFYLQHRHDDEEDAYFEDTVDHWNDDELDGSAGEVIDVVPGALVRQPLDVPRRTSSPAGIQALKAGASLMRDAGLSTDVAEVIAESIQDGLAVAHAQESSVASFDRGEESGVAIGIRRAVQVIERHKAALKDDPYADETIGALDGIVLELVETAGGEG